MKMNEVCKRTNLTERTIRFYIEKGLLQTKSQMINGRTNREFSEDDVNILLDISKLRKAGFSIPDILNMQNGNRNIQDIVEQHYNKLKDEYELRESLLDDLNEIRKRDFISWRKLASLLFVEKNLVLPETLCYPLDGVEFEDSEPLKHSKRTKLRLKWCVIILLIISMIGVLIYVKHSPPSYSAKIFSIGEVVVERKWRDDSGQQYLSIRSSAPYTEYEHYFEYSRIVKINSTEHYETILLDSEPYMSFTLLIEIPYKDAFLSDLLGVDDLLNADQEMIIQRILEDGDLLSKYCVVTNIHAM